MATIALKYIQLSNGRCWQVPISWSGSIGICFNEATAASLGAVLDVNCTGYNAANNPTCLAGDGCFIAIVAVTYANNRVSATVSSSGLTGTLQFSADNQQWVASASQIQYLEVGSYTLYVRDSANPGCQSQRGFTVS